MSNSPWLNITWAVFKIWISSAFLFFISACAIIPSPSPHCVSDQLGKMGIIFSYFLGDSVFLEAKSIQVNTWRPLVAYSFRGSFLWSLACEAQKIYRRSGKQKGLPTCWLMPLTIKSKAWSLTSVSRNLVLKARDTFTQNTQNVQKRTIGSWCFACV